MDAITKGTEDSNASILLGELDYASKVKIPAEMPHFLNIKFLTYFLSVQKREIEEESENDVIGNDEISASLNIRKYIDIITNLQSQIIITEFEENQIWNAKDVLGLAKIYWGLIEPKVEFEKVVEEKEGTAYLEELALLIIGQEYSKYEKVKSIYVQEYRAELQVQVLLSIDEYDDGLMDNLLDTEYDIHKEFPSLTFTFSYLPVGVAEKEDIVHPEARCIFSKHKLNKLWQII